MTLLCDMAHAEANRVLWDLVDDYTNARHIFNRLQEPLGFEKLVQIDAPELVHRIRKVIGDDKFFQLANAQPDELIEVLATQMEAFASTMVSGKTRLAHVMNESILKAYFQQPFEPRVDIAPPEPKLHLVACR